jgi:hypothetical protein
MVVRVTSDVRVRGRGVRGAGGAGLKVTRDWEGMTGAGGRGVCGQQSESWCEQTEWPQWRVVGAWRVRLQRWQVRRWMRWFMAAQA